MIDGLQRTGINDVVLPGSRGDQIWICDGVIFRLGIHARDDTNPPVRLSFEIGNRERNIALDIRIVVERQEDVRLIIANCGYRSARVRQIDRRRASPSLAAVLGARDENVSRVSPP